MLSATTVFACTAVPGTDPIGDSDKTAWMFGFISALIVLACLAFYFLRQRKGRWVVILSAILFGIHPAWWFSSRIGDCGMSKVEYSQWFTAILGMLLIYQAIRWIFSLRSQT